MIWILDNWECLVPDLGRRRSSCPGPQTTREASPDASTYGVSKETANNLSIVRKYLEAESDWIALLDPNHDNKNTYTISAHWWTWKHASVYRMFCL